MCARRCGYYPPGRQSDPATDGGISYLRRPKYFFSHASAGNLLKTGSFILAAEDIPGGDDAERCYQSCVTSEYEACLRNASLDCRSGCTQWNLQTNEPVESSCFGIDNRSWTDVTGFDSPTDGEPFYGFYDCMQAHASSAAIEGCVDYYIDLWSAHPGSLTNPNGYSYDYCAFNNCGSIR
jgi:hypothetical protein